MNRSNLLEPDDRFPANNDHVPLIIPEKHPNNPHNEPGTPYSKLFSYAPEQDKILIIIGSISSIIKGASIPYTLLLIGQIIDVYGNGSSVDKQLQQVTEISSEFYRLGMINFVASFLAMSCWRKSSESQTVEIRKRYLESLLAQDIPFLESIGADRNKDEEFRKIQNGIGEKLSSFISSLAAVLLGIVIAYVQGWKLALSLTGVSLFLFWAVLKLYVYFGLFGKLKQIKDAGDRAENKPKAIAKETLHKIRTVVSLGGLQKEKTRYQAALESGIDDTARLTKISVLVQELSSFGVFLMILLSFYLGSMFITPVKETKDSTESDFTGGKMVTVTACIFTVWFHLGQAFTKMESFAAAKAAGGLIFSVIERRSWVEGENRGRRLDDIVGDIEFRSVRFADPGNPERKILNGVSFHIRQNEKVALVGDSNSGRIACLDLVQRFHNLQAENGSVLLDGHEIRDLNIKWLRDNVGYIGKEPALFASTIRENLLMMKEDASDARLLEVLGQVGASRYIQSLSDSLERLPTAVKYLLNMAQVLLKNPRILIIDEPMVNFGEMNEVIQEALKRISEGRTTIICANSLQTMKNIVDRIIVLDKEKIVEEGNFEDLIEKQGVFSSLHQFKAELPSPPIENKRKQRVSVESRFKGETEKGELSRRLVRYKGQVCSCFAGLLAFVNGFVMAFMAYTLCLIHEALLDRRAYGYDEFGSLVQRFLASTGIYFMLKITQNLMLNLLGDDVARKIRSELFEKFLSMPVVWFDKPESSPEELCKTLSKGVSSVRNYVITEAKVAGLIGLLFAAFCADIFKAAVRSDYHSRSDRPPNSIFWWSLGISVFVLFIEYKKAQLYKRFYPKRTLYEESNHFICKIVKDIKAAASFTTRDKIIENYSLKLDEPLETATLSGIKVGVISGISCFVVLWACAQIFFAGPSQDDDYSKNVQSRIIQNVFLIIFVVYTIKDCFSFNGKGSENLVVLDILRFLDNDGPQNAVNNADFLPRRRNGITGNIEFLNVSFRFQDSERLVFQNLSLKIEPWSKVAFVGLSEEEKSAISVLLQNLYDPMQGAIIVNGAGVEDYESRYLRDSIGILSRRPVLFNGSIEYNIKYGQEELDMGYQEKRDLAEKAGALDFIINNNFEFVNSKDKEKEGCGFTFERLIGSKGGELSQSQTQRIAMTRAIRKNPPVLIVDDVLNGLDTENERLVREPLDSIMEGKTCLIFSNRMSQIKKANEIFVFKEGRLVERGSYDVLVAQQGLFAQLEGNLVLDI